MESGSVGDSHLGGGSMTGRVGAVGLFFCLLLPVPASVARSDDSGPSAEARMFEFLTRNTWSIADAASVPTVTLRRDGRYRWTEQTDVIERDEAGVWSFRLTSDST